MRLYDNAFDSVYDEFRTLYYPVEYRENVEMEAIWRAQGGMLDDVQTANTHAVENNFIEKADAATLMRLEDYFYITPDSGRSIEDLRTLILAFYLGTGHIGEPEIKDVVASFTDGICEVAFSKGIVQISVTRELSDRFNLKDCEFIIVKRLPAHLALHLLDIILPIRLVNRNSVFFREFGVIASFHNRTASFFLDGRQRLDGSWQLGGQFASFIFQDFAVALSVEHSEFFLFPRMHVETTIDNTNIESISNGISLRYRFFNSGENALHTLNGESLLDGSLLLDQTYRGIELDSLGLETGFENKETLAGKITMDSLYALDGNIALNGSRKLNAQIAEEDI